MKSLSLIFFVLIDLDLWLPLNAQAQIFGEAARTEFFGGFGVRVFHWPN